MDAESNWYECKDLGLKQQDILDMKEILLEYLSLLSLNHTCNIVKYSFSRQMPVLYEKKLCRGQIEFIKRVILKEKYSSN